jgi:hypothetical protein
VNSGFELSEIRGRIVHVRGFTLFLTASCLAVAAAAWLTPINRPEQVAVSAIAIGAALMLLVFARSGSANFEPEPDPEAETGSAEPDLPNTEVEPPPPETESQKPGGGRRLRTRKARRLLELEGHLERISHELKVQEQALAQLGDALRQIETDGSEGLIRLARRLDDLETVNAEQRAAIHDAHEQHRQHVDRLQHTIAAHKESLTTIEQMLEAAASPVESL